MVSCFIPHDYDTGKSYMIDAIQALDVLDRLGPPAIKKGKEARVRIQLSTLLPKGSEVARG